MSYDCNLEVSPELRLEAAGFGLESLEADHSIIEAVRAVPGKSCWIGSA
jgi:hypothetical protein